MQKATVAADHVVFAVLRAFVEFLGGVDDGVIRQRRVREAVHLCEPVDEFAHDGCVLPCYLLDEGFGDELDEAVGDVSGEGVGDEGVDGAGGAGFEGVVEGRGGGAAGDGGGDGVGVFDCREGLLGFDVAVEDGLEVGFVFLEEGLEAGEGDAVANDDFEVVEGEETVGEDLEVREWLGWGWWFEVVGGLVFVAGSCLGGDCFFVAIVSFLSEESWVFECGCAVYIIVGRSTLAVAEGHIGIAIWRVGEALRCKPGCGLLARWCRR